MHIGIDGIPRIFDHQSVSQMVRPGGTLQADLNNSMREAETKASFFSR